MWVQGVASAHWIQVLLPSSFLLEKLLLNNSVKLLSVPRPGPTELMLEEHQPVPSCSEKGKVH